MRLRSFCSSQSSCRDASFALAWDSSTAGSGEGVDTALSVVVLDETKTNDKSVLLGENIGTGTHHPGS